MASILIIGGCGYIGSALYKHLTESAHTVRSVDLEWFGKPENLRVGFTNRIDCADISDDRLEWADVVIMAAAHSSVSMCQNDPYGAIRNNVSNFAALLKKMRKGQKLLYCGSSCVYTGSGVLATEKTPLLPPIDYLTLTKQTIDHMACLSDVEFYGLRFGSVNGWSPNLRTDLMINAMTLSGLGRLGPGSRGDQVTLSGMNDRVVRVSNDKNYRPILAMSDLCRAVETITNCSKDRRGIYNLANFNVKIGTVAQVVATITNAKIEPLDGPPGYDFLMCSELFCSTFDFEFKCRLSDIVKSLIDNPPSLMGGRDVNMGYAGV